MLNGNGISLDTEIETFFSEIKQIRHVHSDLLDRPTPGANTDTHTAFELLWRVGYGCGAEPGRAMALPARQSYPIRPVSPDGTINGIWVHIHFLPDERPGSIPGFIRKHPAPREMSCHDHSTRAVSCPWGEEGGGRSIDGRARETGGGGSLCCRERGLTSVVE
jgi:hypothetical protein